MYLGKLTVMEQRLSNIIRIFASLKRKKTMSSIQDIYEAIAAEGYSERVLKLIDEQVNEIQNGTRNFPRYNLPEHAGLCKAGPVLIGASIIASYATRSLTASSHVEGCQGQCKSRAEISSLDLCRDAACARSTEQGGPAL